MSGSLTPTRPVRIATLPPALLCLHLLCLHLPARAVLGSVPTAGVATASLVAAGTITTAGAGVATAGVVKDNYWGLGGGLLIAAGGVGIGFVDPSPATYYSGSFTIHYDPALMTPQYTGWLGSWGPDATALPPPDDPTAWAPSFTVTLQGPAPGLTATVSNDSVLGLQTVAFDWGSDGHDDSAAAFNFFATTFVFGTDVRASLVATAPGLATDAYGRVAADAALPAGANFYLTTPGFACRPPGELQPLVCGDSQTSYYRIEAVPEPADWALMGSGLVLLGAAVKRAGRR
jgi:hypothetical protein